MKLNYRIKSLDEVSFNLNYDFPYATLDKNNINYQFSHELKLNPESEEVILSLKVFLTYGEDNIELYSEAVRTTFEVKPFSSFILDDNDGSLQVSEPLLIGTFVNVTIGAARGMIAKNTKGTPLADCVLPLVPMSLINNMSKK